MTRQARGALAADVRTGQTWCHVFEDVRHDLAVSTLLSSPLLYSLPFYSILPYLTILYGAVLTIHPAFLDERHDLALCSTLRCSGFSNLFWSTLLSSPLLYSIQFCSILFLCILLDSTLLYPTLLHSTPLYSVWNFQMHNIFMAQSKYCS